MTVEVEVWLALNNLRASHRDEGCRPAECALASLTDQELEEILHAIPPNSSASLKEPADIAAGRPALGVVPPAVMTLLAGGESSPEAVTQQSEGTGGRFKVGDRVVYDSEAEINEELGGDYARLGVCTVTELDGEAYRQLISFVDEHGDMHDGWWADRFKAASTEAIVEDEEGDVTYFVAYRSAAGFGYRVLAPRQRIVTSADVTALTDLLATDIGGDVVPLNWIELPPPVLDTAQARQVGPHNSGFSTEIRSALAPPIRFDRKDQVASVSARTMAGTPQPQPVRAAAPGERPDVPYLPRRAM
jgi:hypothetical protein